MSETAIRLAWLERLCHRALLESGASPFSSVSIAIQSVLDEGRARDPLVDPRPLDVIRVCGFRGDDYADLTIVKRMQMRTRGAKGSCRTPHVAVNITRADGLPVEQRGRNYTLAGLQRMFIAGAVVMHKEAP
jgi:hypothetical protein